jgi:pimeloyl-ACP methyl ester carboxylesterase
MAAALFSTAAGAAEGVSNETSVDTWKSVATQTITAGDVSFAYRELGKQNGGTPVVFLVHLAAVLDNWDPRIMEGIAAKHHVIAFDNRGISAVAGVTFYDMLRGFFTGQDAKQFLFFTRTPTGIEAGKAFLERLKERSENRDKEISVSAFLAQLEALRVWGQKAPADLSVVKQLTAPSVFGRDG